MKLLIFSASTGGGHKRAAAALEDTIHRLNPEVEVTVVDGLRAIGKMYDTTTVQGICQGERYTWSANGQVYTTSTQATVNLTSTPGCDSTVHLDLTVMNTSYTVDHIYDCKPYTWINGQTYYTSNTATAILDTVLLQNMWGCDSVVQLDLSIQPVTANIKASRDFFDFDNLDVVLNDISTGSDSRVWQMPNGLTYTSATAFYTMPADLDEADIWLLAASPYGCVDSTHIVIPLRKESFWVPNIFTPESASGNNTFGSISTRTLTQEMHIYNRNGQLVFHCEEPDCQWDGRDPSGNLCPQGTYTYLIRYTNEFLPKVVHVLRGTVTLIR
jgi:gliding motility-associated-like protein